MLFPIREQDLQKCRFTSRFGFQKWRGKVHRGIDIACPVGTPLIAPFDAVVVWCKANHGGSRYGVGNYIVLKNVNKEEYMLLAHLREIPKYKKDDIVKADTVIAYTGNTGHSTGPHVHIEIHHGGFKFENQAKKSGHDSAINPLDVFPQLDAYENKYLKGISFVKEHWGKAEKDKLIRRGISISEERYDDNMTRAEAFALANKILDYLD